MSEVDDLASQQALIVDVVPVDVPRDDRARHALAISKMSASSFDRCAVRPSDTSASVHPASLLVSALSRPIEHE